MPKKGKGPTPKKTRIKLAVCPEPDSMERSIIVPDPNPRDRGDSKRPTIREPPLRASQALVAGPRRGRVR